MGWLWNFFYKIKQFISEESNQQIHENVLSLCHYKEIIKTKRLHLFYYESRKDCSWEEGKQICYTLLVVNELGIFAGEIPFVNICVTEVFVKYTKVIIAALFVIFLKGRRNTHVYK